jgi:AcrR family transcriptional regulator
MGASVRVRGFRQTTLADVVREAKVSRRTFYEHFTDLADCYIALLESLAARNIEVIAEAIAAGGTADERLDRAIGGYLDTLDADPRLMRSFLRELHLTGERGHRLLSSLNERAGQMIHHQVEDLREHEPQLGLAAIPILMARMIAAGIVQMALLAQDEGRPLDEVRTTAKDLLRRAVRAPDN